MLRRRIFHHLRLLFVLTVGLGFGLVVGGLYYLNQSGVNEQWRNQIAGELENLGIIADFERLSISPTKGLLAQGVKNLRRQRSRRGHCKARALGHRRR